MPFLRFSRDKRGYEHFYLVHPTAGRGGDVRPRILYLFRTPPNLKIGRKPFDGDAVEAIEQVNAGLRFDWPKLRETSVSQPENEYWRERRQAERAARASRQAEAGSGESEGVNVEPGGEDAAAEGQDSQPAGMADTPATATDVRQSLTPSDSRELWSRRRRGRHRGPRRAGPDAGPGVRTEGTTEESRPSSDPGEQSNKQD